MKPGDLVTGDPIPVNGQEFSPVTGVYEEREWSLGDETEMLPFINVDGESVDCTNIRPANRRERMKAS